LPQVTVTGNEITDVVRAANVEGDGLSSSDSSYGIWSTRNNYCRNGNAATNLTDWLSDSGATVTRDTTESKFGSTSVKVVTPGSVVGEGVRIASDTGLAMAAGRRCFGGAWVWGSGTIETFVEIKNTDATFTYGGSTQYTLTSTPQRLDFSFVDVEATKTGDQITLYILTVTSAQAITFHVGGVMIEHNVSTLGASRHPYVHTDGTTASKAVGRIQMPVGNLSKTQGWMAARVRAGVASAVVVSGMFPQVLNWGVSDSDEMGCGWRPDTGVWYGKRDSGGVNGTRPEIAGTFVRGDLFTLVFAWTATQLKLSLNGSVFTVTAHTGIPSVAFPDTLDIGRHTFSVAEFWNGEILWVAMGSGTLSDADAVTLHGFGNSDPEFGELPGSPLAVWHANTIAYIHTPDQTVIRSHGVQR
jgi:hypothetical protein